MDGIPLLFKYTVPDKLYEKFWEGLKKGEIYTTKCKKCGTLYYPPRKDCEKCMSSDMEWVKLSNEGILMTYSIVKQKPQGFENYSDYIVGIARNSDGVNLMCWVKGEAKVGKKVRLTTDGQRVICEVIE
ncbi:Zn-ribbon domain-containing OB-fold protein [Sulfurisphaera ohwakuensis]|uniref:DNA-binding protein n=1 Tax=Sulfurisphaera ohwakuensis TaxID=69656 RepID=A0A650CJQ2_SULOH|nr:Zn-ribbon domain-containing OB-fold protein [Sulfurisphaera ohwakuensis]MBB5254657.1 hypothetical protein [Sulfurisphaera ohwakuensis]QGR18046.1 DNA-binding protein [Sulfurisphaera ohwakuensis]